MASMNTRLNIEKLDGNIVQKHGGSKQVGFKQLGLGVKTGVHGVHDEKRVWFEVELQGAQGNREAEGQEKEYQTGWKIKTGNVLDSCNQRSTQQCMKSGSGMSKVFLAEDTTRSTYLVNRSPSSATGFKKLIDMLGFFSWLASIEQGMLEPVKVKCIFLGYHESIVGNKLWRLDGVTSNVVLYRNMDFNERGEYKKTFISSGVGTGSMHVLHRFEFEVEPLGNHTFEVEPQENVDQGASLQEVQTQDLMDYQLARDREQHLACELCGYREDTTVARKAVTTTTAITRSMHQAEIWVTKGLLVKAKGNILGLEIIMDQSGNTLRVSQSRFYNGKLVQTLLEGHSILSLEGSLSGDCDVEKNGKWSCIYAVGSREYQMVCTRLEITSADVGMLDKFDRGLQTHVQVLWILTTPWEDRSLLWVDKSQESRYELSLVAATGIATGVLIQGERFKAVVGELGSDGELVQIAMIQKLLSSKLGSLMNKFGDFDFIICQNPYTYFARSATETESYEGLDMSMFFDFVRVLRTVRSAIKTN
ncbi:hypothetical protein Tco_0140977 [Tanacetum coccineum]